MSSCFSCFTASFKIYHFDNFTFVRSRDTFQNATRSFRQASFLSNLHFPGLGPSNNHNHNHSHAASHNQSYATSHNPSYATSQYHTRDHSPIHSSGGHKRVAKRTSLSSSVMSQGGYQPPSGPPPTQGGYQAPSGPPPSHYSYQAPSGPPPSQGGYAPPPVSDVEALRRETVYRSTRHVSFAPVERHTSENAYPDLPIPILSPAPFSLSGADHSKGPPPSNNSFPSYSTSEEPPPYDPNDAWKSIPDTSLLPPPPGISHHASPAGNADATAADAAHAWTEVNPLWPPKPLQQSDNQALSICFSALIAPPEMNRVGRATRLPDRAGVTAVSTTKKCDDVCLLSSLPLYSPFAATPMRIHRGAAVLAYFEVGIHKLAPESGIAIGFTAPPFPTWRLPGWERASLAVHGDDGRRFVNDTWGGRDFTNAFEAGERVGIGLELTPLPGQGDLPPLYGEKAGGKGLGAQARKMDVKVFFTRNGKRSEEGEWDLHEEIDAEMDQPGGVTGLEGANDLHAAVGIYGAVECRVHFGRHEWLYKPS